MIDYQYDSLYRLTEANYSDGRFFHYAYDSNGNRVSETTAVGTVESVYDSTNRLTSVGASGYTWDVNGNLTNDGGRVYAYNSANRLTAVTQNGQTVNYGYNGQGDRLVEGETEFEMDLNTGLTQVLSDGTNAYLYGSGRIGQFTGVDSAYFLGDALGSVRQLTNKDGVTTMGQFYAPYGDVMSTTGDMETTYGYTGEWQSSLVKLINLRSRLYSPGSGHFLSRDTWEGEDSFPMSFNGWLYAMANPINLTDPSGQTPMCPPYYSNCLEPNVIEYDERISPSGILFDPLIDPLYRGAVGIPKGYHGGDASQFIKGWDKPNENNTGLCGQVSIAAILGSYGDPIPVRDLVEIYYFQAKHRKIEGAYAPTDEWPKDDYINYTGPDELADFINKNMGVGHADARSLDVYIKNADQWEGQWAPEPPYNRQYGKQVRDLIKGWLDKRKYPMITVRVAGDSSLHGGKVASGANRHWVVITGISQDFSLKDPSSAWNWLRIYNPFNNQTEYYWFPDIFPNWIARGELGGSGGMVLMSPGQFRLPYCCGNCP